MNNKIFPKVTKIEGGTANVVSPEFNLATNSAVVFLIGETESPITVKIRGIKGEESKNIAFKSKSITDIEWNNINEDGLTLESSGAFLVAIEADTLAHDEWENITLVLDGGEDGTTPEVVFAFEIASRYLP